MDPFSLDHIIIRSSARGLRRRRLPPHRVSQPGLVPQALRRPPEAFTQSIRTRQYQSARGHSSASSLPLGQQLGRAPLHPSVVKDHVRWRYGDLNPRPMACKATALATELYPQVRSAAASSLRTTLRIWGKGGTGENGGLRLGFRLDANTQKGGDPAAPSGTATLLRLHPPHQAYLRQRPPCG